MLNNVNIKVVIVVIYNFFGMFNNDLLFIMYGIVFELLDFLDVDEFVDYKWYKIIDFLDYGSICVD